MVGTRDQTRFQALKAVLIGICRENFEALLEFGATLNLLSNGLTERLAVTLQKDFKRIITVNGVSCVFSGLTCHVPVSFNGELVRMKFLVLQSAPFDTIFERTKREEIQGYLEIDSRMATLLIKKTYRQAIV